MYLVQNNDEGYTFEASQH